MLECFFDNLDFLSKPGLVEAILDAQPVFDAVNFSLLILQAVLEVLRDVKLLVAC
jgi:hypothetical protein